MRKEAKRLSLLELTHDPNNPYHFHWWRYPSVLRHSHTDFYELFFPVQGGMEHWYDGKIELLRERTLYLIPLHRCHELRSCGGDGKSPNHFVLDVRADVFRRMCETCSVRLSEQLTRGADCIAIPLDDIEFSYIHRLAQRATLATDDRGEQERLLLLLLHNTFLLYELKCLSPARTENARYAADLKGRIDRLELLGDDLRGVYASYPVSPTTLIHEFRRLTGQTIVGYLAARRIDYARTMLVNTDYTVSQIAGEAGYDSLSHFIHTFKRRTGLTPTAYRRASRPL